MNSSRFDLYFFFKNRKKIEDSFFLETFDFIKLKDRVLEAYNINTYKKMDISIIFLKILLFSIFYYVLILSTYMNSEGVLILGYIILFVTVFLGTLLSLEMNKGNIPDIEHDHYFRMIGDKRNDLIREEMTRRLKYTFTNWLIPFTLFPFLYVSFFDGFQYLAIYSVLMILLYLITSITVFVVQRLRFDTLRHSVVLNGLVLYILLVIVVVVTVCFTVLPLFILSNLENRVLGVALLTVYYGVLIFGLYRLLNNVRESSLNYSLTNALLTKNKSRIDKNLIKEPNLFFRMLSGKNDFENKLLYKDFLTYYRKDKKEAYFINVIKLRNGN